MKRGPYVALLACCAGIGACRDPELSATAGASAAAGGAGAALDASVTDAIPADTSLADAMLADTTPADAARIPPVDAPAVPPACSSAAACGTPSVCQAFVCDPQFGCLAKVLPDGAACSAGPCLAGGACSAGACQGAKPRNCDDANPCTDDACDPATDACSHKPNQAACDDGSPCTSGDACSQGGCQAGTTFVCACQNDADCAKEDDKDACNGTLYCDKSAAVWACHVNPATVVTCPKAASDCQVSACNPKTGQCSQAAAKDGKPCSDGDPCTLGDACKGGACVAGTGACCAADADCAKVEDGNACNGTLYCNLASGTCELSPLTVVQCPTVNDTACLKAICVPKTGLCVPKEQGDGSVCDDGNLCTTGDSCQGGKCLPSFDTCACKSNAECALKDDGNLCNGIPFCNKATGKCEVNPASVVTCASGLDTACTKHVCLPAAGTCTAQAVADVSPCDADGNACTVGDHCQAGACVAGTDVCACKSDAECAKKDDGNVCNGTLYCDKTSGQCLLNPKTVVVCPNAQDTQCRQNLCDPASGLCAPKNVNQFQTCDADGLLCTFSDTCLDGVCKPGANVCECLKDGDCQDDGNLCNGSPYCDKTKVFHVCATKPNSVVTCAELGQPPCSTTGCDPKSGKCATQLGQDGVVCDDGTVCTIGDACSKGACVPALGLECDDGSPCTLDACSPKTGCLHLPIGATCTDGDACTQGDGCTKGKCLGTATVTCQDGNPCTTDACDKAKGCVFVANTQPCSDGDVCTLGDVCQGGQCASLGKNPCSDGEPCTVDSCDPGSGLCSHKAGATCARTACLGVGDCEAGHVCDTGKASCVSCLHASDCGSSQACQGGLCIAGTACASFVPCKPLGMVCDNATGSCVECLLDGDCGTGKVCQGQRCAPKVACNTDADCPAVCDLSHKVCADCNAPGDCPGGTCGLDHMCRPGHTGGVQCVGGNLFTPAPGKQAYVPTLCDDANLCTDGACALPSGCTTTANSAPCDDGDVCTGSPTQGDTCKAGKCAPGNGNACDDAKPCTNDTCAAGSGACSHDSYEGPCSDGNACTVSELCQNGSCKGGKVLVCDDANACTDDSCEPKAGCVFAANANPCDSGSCTTADQCQGGTCTSSNNKLVWEAVVSGLKAATVRGLVPTAGGFYAVVRHGSGSQPDGGALWRVDGQGKVLWQVEPSLGPGGAVTGVAVSGSDAVVCGANCSDGTCHRWLARYSADGKELATVTTNLGTTYAGRVHALVPYGSGFLTAGWQAVVGQGTGAYVAWFDANLAQGWVSYAGNTGGSEFTAIALAGSDIVAAGWTATAANGSDGLVVRMSGNGAVTWKRSLGGAGKDEFRAVVAMANGDMSLAGVTGSKGKGGNDGWFVRLVAMGEVADDRTFGTAGNDEFLAAVEGPGDGVTFAGRLQGKGTATQGWLLAIDGWGNPAFQRTSGGAFGEDGFHALTQFSGGLLAGGNRSDLAGLASAAFVRTDTWGHASCTSALGCLGQGANDCDDAHECTLDGCENGQCVHANAELPVPCDSKPGFCQDGACQPPVASCKALQTAAPGVRSGVFHIDPDGALGSTAPYPVWCDQNGQGGGWTLVLKADAKSQNFIFASPQWHSPTPFGADQPGYDTAEAKLPSYTSLPIKELRVGLRTGGVLRQLAFAVKGASLYSQVSSLAPTSSANGIAAWANLAPGMSVINEGWQEGINPVGGNQKVRIGCTINVSSASWAVGLGAAALTYGNNNVVPVGGVHTGTLVNPPVLVPAFGYVFAR